MLRLDEDAEFELEFERLIDLDVLLLLFAKPEEEETEEALEFAMEDAPAAANELIT